MRLMFWFAQQSTCLPSGDYFNHYTARGSRLELVASHEGADT